MPRGFAFNGLSGFSTCSALGGGDQWPGPGGIRRQLRELPFTSLGRWQRSLGQPRSKQQFTPQRKHGSGSLPSLSLLGILTEQPSGNGFRAKLFCQPSISARRKCPNGARLVCRKGTATQAASQRFPINGFAQRGRITLHSLAFHARPSS